MPNYRIDFYGTPNGGLNSAYKEHISRVVYANNKEGARLEAYRTHEHIHDTIYESALGIIEHYPVHGENKGLEYCKEKAAEALGKKQAAMDGVIYAQIDGRDD